MPKLKPCPFCGRKPHIQKNPTGQNEAAFAVKCTCGVLTRFQDRRYKAVDIWNRRARAGVATLRHTDEKDEWYAGYYTCLNCGTDMMLCDSEGQALCPVCCPSCKLEFDLE